MEPPPGVSVVHKTYGPASWMEWFENGHKHTHSVQLSKGTFVGDGATAIVEQTSDNRVTKSAWIGEEYRWNIQDLDLEAKIYGILGEHPRFIRFFEQCPDHSLVLEYMPVGNVRDYLRSRHDDISPAQRLQWILQAAEGLQILHSNDIVHCDFSPRNLLLSDSLQLKIIDFGCVSLGGSPTPAMGAVRYHHPSTYSKHPTVLVDIFSLGSTIYELLTGQAPYEDVSTDQVKQLYKLSQFPDLTGVWLSDIIRRCWALDFERVADIHRLLQDVTVS